jgi:hypothetical protein
MKLVSPVPAALFSGQVTMNGRVIQFERLPGMQGHNWGRKHSHHYCWAHCSAFENESPSVYFEGFSAKIKLGPVVTPYLSMAALHLEDQTLRWNSLTAAATHRIRSDENSWRFRFSDDRFALEGSFASDRFAALDYINPNGTVSLCRNSKRAGAELTLYDRRTGSPIRRLIAPAAAALEILDRTERSVTEVKAG